MGRLRIKKKDLVIPFRQTLAYRSILLAGSVLLLFFGLYVLYGAMISKQTPAFLLSAFLGIVGAALTFYNYDQLRHAKIPERTAKRARLRK